MDGGSPQVYRKNLSNMREFKFRVWSIEEKQFISPNILEVFDESGDLTPFKYIKTGKLNPLYMPVENYIIQQYTGIKDKYGKEIYCGDIVELHTAANDKAKDVKDNHYGLYEIYWDRKYKLKEIKPNWFFKVIDNDCASFNIMKVVSNVFEHKEV